jgi:UDP-N-acetyl-D-galactosamine dehydrogenase
MDLNKIRIGVVGLGYVGLPVAVHLGKKFTNIIGFDISKARVETLKKGFDKNGDLANEELASTALQYTSEEKDLKGLDFYVVAVPTPIDSDRRPDLTPLKKASELIGRQISKGATIVFESTVYPGVTEEFCGPIIQSICGLKQGVDFKLGYSPERINPGDKEHTIEKIVKVVSGEDADTLELVASVYSEIIEAGVHKASSIKVAEAAKVIENTQRDLNIALMNELAQIFDKMGISTTEVLLAAGTKWNFLKFSPGLVGGHCIGVDPYYLTSKAEQLGYRPRVILAGRSINDGMGAFVAEKTVKLMIQQGKQVKGSKVGILGLTFKENVSDIRNSRVPDIIKELGEYGINCQVVDPLADPHECEEEFGLKLVKLEELRDLDALVLAVSHDQFLEMSLESLIQVC